MESPLHTFFPFVGNLLFLFGKLHIIFLSVSLINTAWNAIAFSISRPGFFSAYHLFKYYWSLPSVFFSFSFWNSYPRVSFKIMCTSWVYLSFASWFPYANILLCIGGYFSYMRLDVEVFQWESHKCYKAMHLYYIWDCLLWTPISCPFPAEEPRSLQRKHALTPSPCRIAECNECVVYM